MPSDSQGFMNEWKGKPVDSIVEQVREGSTLRVRMILSDDTHQFVNVALAGVRTPRAAGREGESAEQWGEEVRIGLMLLKRAFFINLCFIG